jgi:urease accessory protein
MAAITTPEAPAPIRGQGGLLEVRADLIGGRTRFTDVVQRPPLGISRAIVADPAHPRMASALLTSAAGGVLQGDVLETRIAVGPGAWLQLGTQSATRFYRMPHERARLATTLEVAAEAWLEVVPDPWIPYAGADIDSRTRCTVDPDGVLVLAEILTAGRVARGERLAFARVESIVDVAVGGVPCARDVVRLDPAAGLGRIGALGPFSTIGSLLVVARGVSGESLAPAAHTDGPWWAGTGDLPAGAGAWLRVLGHDERAVMRCILAAWSAVRSTLGAPPPPLDRRG